MIRVGVTTRWWTTSSAPSSTPTFSAHASAAAAASSSSSQVRADAGWVVGVESGRHPGTANVRHTSTRILQALPKAKVILSADARSAEGRMVRSHERPPIVLLTRAPAGIQDAATSFAKYLQRIFLGATGLNKCCEARARKRSIARTGQ